jgi:hypothetical protein
MRNSLLLKGLLATLFSLSTVVLAADANVCMPAEVKAQNKNIILPGVTESHTIKVYFVHNTSDKSLWIDHPSDSGSAKAGWASFIQPGKWSALQLNRKNFILSCAVINPGQVDYQNCSKVVTICIPQQMVVSSKQRGSYWLVENKLWDGLLKALEKRGIQVNKPKK